MISSGSTGDGPIVHTLVMRDIEKRMEAGILSYGTGLRPFNDRDALWDAYEEVLDLACYLRQHIFERDQIGNRQ